MWTTRSRPGHWSPATRASSRQKGRHKRIGQTRSEPPPLRVRYLKRQNVSEVSDLIVHLDGVARMLQLVESHGKVFQAQHRIGEQFAQPAVVIAFPQRHVAHAASQVFAR